MIFAACCSLLANFIWYINKSNYYSFLGKYSYKVVPLWMKTCLYYTSSLVQMMCLISIAHHCLYWRDAWFILYMHPLSYCTVHSWVLLHSCWQIWEFYFIGRKLRKWHKNHLCDMKLVVLSSFPYWNGKRKSCKINFWVGFLCKITFLGINSRAKMAHPRPSIYSLTPPPPESTPLLKVECSISDRSLRWFESSLITFIRAEIPTEPRFGKLSFQIKRERCKLHNG